MDSDQLADSVRFFVAGVNAGDADVAERFIAPEFYNYQPGPDDPTATEVWGQLLTDVRAGMPDLRVENVQLEPAADGELAGSVIVQGTHTGTVWGAPPSGAVISWQPQIRVRPVDGRFAVNFEAMAAPQMIAVLRQLGLVNPPDEMHLPPRNPDARPPEFLLRVAFNGGVAPRPCGHLETATVFDPGVVTCEQCVAAGETWPALRMCMTCGYVGCCDTSLNTHMKRHAEETGHVLMRSIHGPEGWMWCYADNAFFDSATLARLRARKAGG
jgi:SnoaL-like polyketide cyclase/Zn-finger in ubiquitin-hydrolases and other protein